MPGMVDDLEPPTRAEIEQVLREYDFEPSEKSPHVWQNAERTKFLAFPEGEVPIGKEATAIYGDAERGEPGRALTFLQAQAVVTGRLELDSPALTTLAMRTRYVAGALGPVEHPLHAPQLSAQDLSGACQPPTVANTAGSAIPVPGTVIDAEFEPESPIAKASRGVHEDPAMQELQRELRKQEQKEG